MRLLLDTNVVVWLLTAARERVSPAAVEALEDPANELHVSALAWWEIAIKRSLGKMAISDGWSSAILELGLAPLPLLPGHAAAVEALPWHHRDPFDRALVAQAQAEELTLVTPDRRIAAYGVPVLW